MEFFGSKSSTLSLVLALSIGAFSMAQSATAAADDKPVCDTGTIGTACEPDDKDIVIGSALSSKRVVKPGTGPTFPLPDQVPWPTNKPATAAKPICDTGTIGTACEPSDKDIVIGGTSAKRAIRARN